MKRQSRAIDLSNLDARTIDEIKLEIILMIMRIFEVREHSQYTFLHSDRVASLSALLAQEMEMPPRERNLVYRGALLHDIGKTGTEAHLLFSEEKLSFIDRVIIERHCEWGEYILSSNLFTMESLIVKQHHEWWNGEGYPDGLKGEEISSYAQIVTIADVYDALKTDRPYEKPWSHERAIKFIVDKAGVMFNPYKAHIFKQIHDNGIIQEYYKNQGID